ncbi:MAG: UvrD-helicase domain-containing protein [Bacteroidaceae bacterium]|nr:UvrD-helicase domain-containing protein [Bacteroidaceae bacterium]
MNKTLYIYRASAGSGKTFTLALEYIKLLIANPENYRHILAVTFTNKATSEMKERIMSKLYGIANRLPSSDDYTEKLLTTFPNLSKEKIIERAETALEMLLHDYGHFRIQTIDAFFQTILRGLAKELDLSNDMEISINGTKFLHDAVDILIKQLKPTSEQMSWLVEYIEEHLENDKSWKIRDSIKKFAENILKEEYQERGENLRQQIEENNGAQLAEYRKTLRKIEKEIIAKVKSIGNRFFEIANDAYLTDADFYKKKNGIYSFFRKLQNGELPEITPRGVAMTCMDNPQKISERLSIDKCNEIANLIKEYYSSYEKDSRLYNSCSLSLIRFHQLRLLDSIGKQLQEENSRENRFLLAQTTFLLSKMIENSTTFIFEKIGSEISHIFIDEFQDTSKLQWQCFKVLLQEVMAHGTKNLIVGDVKQSIYRWRNSDWNILNHIEGEFHTESIGKYEIISNEKKESGYTTNYRSERRIIEFNNKFFEKSKDIIEETYSEKLGNRIKDFQKAYAEVKQEIPDNKPNNGYVEIRLLKEKEKKYDELAYSQLMDTLRVLLLEKGVKPNDITILVRVNRFMPIIARHFNETFKEYNFGIVSDDAYRLSSSVAINIIIAAIRYITMPEDRINLIQLLMLYLNETKGIATTPQVLAGNRDLTTMLPNKFISKIDHLGEMPIYELIEQLIELFELNTMQGEEAFLYSFLDCASQYINCGISDLTAFLDEWDEELANKTIPTGETNSVRMMTIHKSKGLEFHTVIIPFGIWKLTGEMHSHFHENLIWCHPKEVPFNYLDLLPIEFVNDMQNSIYEEEFNHEYLFQLVDNMNLMYVAFTRAKNNLFIFSDKDAKKDTMGKHLETMIGNMGSDEIICDTENGILTYGEIMPSIEKEKKSDNPFTQIPQEKEQPFISFDNHIPFRQSNNLTRFLARNREEEEQLEYQMHGILMHELLSKLETGDNLKQELKKLQIEGLIGNEKEYNKIKKLIERALSNPKASEWFSGKYKLFNECSILYKEDNEYKSCRPDRVMIYDKNAVVVDFKFGKHKEEYITQIEKYKSILREMGYENVTGHIWYVYTNKIV